MGKIHIKDLFGFEDIKTKIKLQGKNSLYIVADFDRTLTYGFFSGEKTPSIISILRSKKLLSDEYSKKSQELYEKYHSFETDLKLSLNEREKLMYQWWKEHYELLSKENLTKEILIDMIKNQLINLRDGVHELVKLAHKNNIPFIIFSSSGLGDTIKMLFEYEGLNYENVHFLVNEFIWDGNIAIKNKEPIIHVLNKDFSMIKKIPEIHKAIQGKTNVILLGDSLSDLNMVKKEDSENLITIGLYNSEDNFNLKKYIDSFNVVLADDQDILFVRHLLNELILYES